MSPKTKPAPKNAMKPAKAAKAAPTKKSAAPSKGPAKAEKGSKAIVMAAPVEGAPVVDAEELEEAEAERASASSSGGGADAALAAASSSTEMSASFKNFRHHPDMENFYRFIYENDLRHEALVIMDTIQSEKQARRMAKTGKLNAH